MSILHASASVPYPIDLDFPVGGLKQTLSKLLLSVDRVGWQTGATSGRFDVRRTSRMLAGSERAFKARTEDAAVTTAVTIVVDLSSSMAGERAQRAAQTAWALADAIERVGCMVQVLGFTSGYSSEGSYVAPKYMRNSMGQIEAPKGSGVERSYSLGCAQVLKGFEHKLRDRRAIFQYMEMLVTGTTPDYHVIRTAVQHLSMVPTDRRLCIVITDGYGDTGLMHAMKDVTEKLWKTPIVGIGIQTDKHGMSYCYKQFACINEVAELAQGALRTVIDQLGGKKKALA
jgi:hypothetical protein